MAYSNGHAEMLFIKKLEPVQVVPAKKTPGGLYFLSGLDQTLPYPIEIVFMFKGNESDTSNAAEILKTSLAKVLVEFYPLAGCLTTTWDGKMIVRCTGEGVPFVEAVSASEVEILGDISKIVPARLRKLVHFNEGVKNILEVPPLTVQVTRFRCGAVVVGLGFNHVLVDGIAFLDFMISWGEVARGIPLSVPPHLDRSIVSARKPLLVDIYHDEYIKSEQRRDPISFPQKGEFENKSFSFDGNNFSRLRKLAMVGNEITESPTNFELISALIWVNWTKALKIEPEKTTQIITFVDGRTKFNPPLPKGYFGNGIATSCAQSKARDLFEKPFSYAVKIFHQAIKAVTEDYIKSAIDHYEVARQQLENQNTLRITKWSRLPFHEVNFGWGKCKTSCSSFTFGQSCCLSIGRRG